MRLALSRHGNRLAALDNGELRLLDLSGKQPAVTTAAPNGTDLVLFDEELWVVAQTTLHRHALNLREIGRAELPPGSGLVRAPSGTLAALWLPAPGGQPMLLRARGVDLDIAPLAIDYEPSDRLAALSAQRFARLRAGELALFDASGAVRWRHDTGPRPIAVAAIADGRAIAAISSAADPANQQLVVLDQRDGRLQHRLALRGVTDGRFTALRSLAVLLAGEKQVIVVDLRFGKVLCHHEETRPILDVAIDDSGQHVVLRLRGERGNDEVIDVRIADLVAGRTALASAQSEPFAAREASTPAAPQLTVEPAPALTASPPQLPEEPPAVPDAFEVPTLRALGPKPAHPQVTPVEAIRMLERYRQLIAALAARAIAAAWDAGTIAFVDETGLPFEKEVAALALGTRGLASDHVRKADEAVAVAHRGLKDAEAALGGRLPPLAQLAGEFGLRPLDQHLLMLVAAPSLWGELARLYGILANDEHRPICDELLLYQLSGPGADRHEIARALERGQPLIRHGLIRQGTDRARPFTSLTVDPLVLKILRADPLDADLEMGIQVVRATRSLDQLRVPRGELARVIRALATEPATPARLVVRGRTGSGRSSVVAALASHAGRQLGSIDATRFVRERRIDQLELQLRRIALRGWIPLVGGLEVIASDDTSMREAVRDVLAEHPGPLALRLPHDATPPLRPGFILLDLPTLTVAERAEHWREVLAREQISVEEVDSLAARFAIGPGVIERVVASVTQTVARERDATREIEQAVRQHLASRLGEVATRVTRLANWSQVVLPSDIHDSILELVARIRHRRTVFDEWGFDQVMTTSRGITVLFQGGPGTGKTLVAGAIANELGLDLYRIDLSRVMSKWIGETEQNLAKVFAAAEEGQAILLFDEADSLFAKRTEVRTSVDRYANLEVNYLLQRLDSFEGIAILTTNFGTAIDAAFKRRLSFRLTFPFPDDETRELLWKAHLPEKLPRAGTLDLAALARRYQMSGGYIRNAALRAAFLAAEEQSPLTQEHLERAIRAEFREIGKLAETGVLE